MNYRICRLDACAPRRNFLLISLIIHIAAFVILGVIVIENSPEPRESVSVHLLKAKQRELRLRRNTPASRSVSIGISPSKSPNMVKQVVNRGNVSVLAVAESAPVFRYETAELEKPKLNPRIVPPSRPLAAPKISASRPVVRSPEVSIFEIHSKFARLSPSYNSMPLPVYNPTDPAAMRSFLQTIGRRIEESKRYPKWAMDTGLEGKVVIRFTVLRDGSLGEEFLLVRSSGTEILDNAAIAAIKEAAPFPALPRSLGRERLQIELPMDFQLVES